MTYNIDNVKNLFEQLKTIGFLSRLFGWKRIKNLLIDAAGDVQKLVSHNDSLAVENQKLTTDYKVLSETNRNLYDAKSELQIELASIKEKLANAETLWKKASEQNTQLLKDQEFREKEHSNAIASLHKIQQQIQEARNSEIEQRNSAEIDRIKHLKETWTRHEGNVSNVIKNICHRQVIDYVEHVPFKGNPDNTVKICDEYIIFDAKSPGGDDFTNFPAYLKDQAEKAKKYARQENVKTDIFFVVPSNTLDKLSTFVYKLGDYDVYIISIDSLEPVILSLKKIEDYEFAEQLSPEERENICRILGKFAHLSKRRIQVDSFFAKQFIELAYKCESDLPADILEKVIEFEKSEKLNPPIEKRAKAINIKELEKDAVRLKDEAAAKGILIEEDKISSGLNEMPLYKNEN